MQKWPNVPNVFGWLRLDPRGNWWIRSGARTRARPGGRAGVRAHLEPGGDRVHRPQLPSR
ncbi:MAG: DUF2946 family protein [Burkholderiales bacterium]|nr:DUF2946 family protein [Burkholderiales bacterium]